MNGTLERHQHNAIACARAVSTEACSDQRRGLRPCITPTKKVNHNAQSTAANGTDKGRLATRAR